MSGAVRGPNPPIRRREIPPGYLYDEMRLRLRCARAEREAQLEAAIAVLSPVERLRYRLQLASVFEDAERRLWQIFGLVPVFFYTAPTRRIEGRSARDLIQQQPPEALGPPRKRSDPGRPRDGQARAKPAAIVGDDAPTNIPPDPPAQDGDDALALIAHLVRRLIAERPPVAEGECRLFFRRSGGDAWSVEPIHLDEAADFPVEGRA